MQKQKFRSLYIHIPFCDAKCDYCSFYSTVNFDISTQEIFLQRLEKDFFSDKHSCEKLRSIFIGGGTPSCLNLPQFEKLFLHIHKHFDLSPDCEITMEANPSSLCSEKIAIATALGLNRLSLGIQSFNNKIRKTLGRKGKLDNLAEIFKYCHKKDLYNINFDLIFNIPGQTPTDWREDLIKASSYDITHLSTYELIIDENTAFGQKENLEQDDLHFLKFWDLSDEIMSQKNMQRYEIANFAQENKRCRHNYEIWHGQTYLGCGPAAVSFDGITRYANQQTMDIWLNSTKKDKDIISEKARACEILAFGLRCKDGWEIEDFEKLSGYNIWQLREEELKKLQKAKLIKITQTTIKPTKQGLHYNNHILEELI